MADLFLTSAVQIPRQAWSEYLADTGEEALRDTHDHVFARCVDAV